MIKIHILKLTEISKNLNRIIFNIPLLLKYFQKNLFNILSGYKEIKLRGFKI